MPKRIIASADLIKEFQRIVRGYATAGDEKIELPTEFLVPIANVLDRVKRSKGAPRKSGRIKVLETVIYFQARAKMADLKRNGISPAEALMRMARELKRKPPLSKLSLNTIKDRLQRKPR